MPETSFTREYTPPCQVGCPLGMDIRSYIDLIAQGRIMEALRVIRESNPFPSICAYVCTSPCEGACRRDQVDKAIAIRALKRFALEFGGDKMIQLEARTTREERVAIVGSGPAGLSCSFYLRRLGYPATVFETHSKLGGMLREGIPRYRLPGHVLDNEIDRLIGMGVEVRPDTKVVSLDLLFEMGYEAVFITIGANRSMKLGVEGEESSGVLDGATFLHEVNLGMKPMLGEKVAIVGGGNSAVDAARTAVRLGSKKVTIIYRRSREEMPADPVEVNHAEEEGVEIHFLVAPVNILRKDGRLIVTCIRMQLGEPDERGRRRPVPMGGSDFDLKFDTLITAIGQKPQVPGDFGIEMNRGETIRIDPVTFSTNRVGVFAGGDAVTGPATVVEALASGRSAAMSIDDYLRKGDSSEEEVDREEIGLLRRETIEMIRKNNRFEPPITSPESRKNGFGEVELVYDWESAVEEARRCLWCGSGAEISSEEKCADCLTCVRVCPYKVPGLDESGSVTIAIDQCQSCGVCVAECPAKAISLRKASSNGEFAAKFEVKPFIVGYYCRYGLFGSGTLSSVWRDSNSGILVEPVECIVRVEASQMLSAFEKGAEGVIIVGCGEKCARKGTDYWINQRIERVRRTLAQINLEPQRVQLISGSSAEDAGVAFDKFAERVGGFYLESIVGQEMMG